MQDKRWKTSLVARLTWIKVKEDWRNKENLMRSFGFDSNDFQ